MKYSNENVRRQDRVLDEQSAEKLLREGEYGVLSMPDPLHGAYGIPVNYVWDGKDSVYIHCAPEGRKLRLLDDDSRVSFCVVGRTKPVPDKFTTEYESIVLQCTARRGLPPEERMLALELIVDKYSPGFRETGRKYAEGSFGRTEVIRLDIGEWSGKCKKL